MNGTPRAIDSFSSLRGDFPILNQEVNGYPLVYLDNAATSQKPTSVIERLVHFYTHENANVHRGFHELSNRATRAYEGARQRVADFIHAGDVEEIIFTRGTTESINLVANTWGELNVGSGDSMLITEMEHHSNLVPWQMLTCRKRAQLLYLPVTPNGLLDWSHLDQILKKNHVKLLAFTHVSNTLGTINPVRQICSIARENGVLTLVDAAQSAGHMPIDVQELGCDFLAFSGHKMCAPTGIGVLYGKKELLNAMPPWQGGGEMIFSVSYSESAWKTAPHKFEAGTPDISGAIGLHAAMDYLDAVGRERIFEHDQELAAFALEQLSTVQDLQVLGEKNNRAGLLTFVLSSVHAHDMVSFANRQGVALRGGHHCNQPLMRKLGHTSTVRASFYLYNDKEEINALVRTLNEAKHFFRRGTR